MYLYYQFFRQLLSIQISYLSLKFHFVATTHTLNFFKHQHTNWSRILKKGCVLLGVNKQSRMKVTFQTVKKNSVGLQVKRNPNATGVKIVESWLSDLIRVWNHARLLYITWTPIFYRFSFSKNLYQWYPNHSEENSYQENWWLRSENILEDF